MVLIAYQMPSNKSITYVWQLRNLKKKPLFLLIIYQNKLLWPNSASLALGNKMIYMYVPCFLDWKSCHLYRWYPFCVSVSQLVEYKCQSAVHLSVLHPMKKMLRVLIVVCWSPSLVKKRMVEGTLPAINFRLHTPLTVELEVSVRVISVISHGLTRQDQTSRRSHFKYHAKTQFHHFDV